MNSLQESTAESTSGAMEGISDSSNESSSLLKEQSSGSGTVYASDGETGAVSATTDMYNICR